MIKTVAERSEGSSVRSRLGMRGGIESPDPSVFDLRTTNGSPQGMTTKVVTLSAAKGLSLHLPDGAIAVATTGSTTVQCPLAASENSTESFRRGAV